MNPIDRLANDEPAEVLVFTSPKAGSGAGREQIPRLIETIERLGRTASIVATVAELQDRVAAAKNPIVVAAGGDGTVALAAQSIDAGVAIVPMPLGTENLLAIHFGHRVDAEQVAATIRYGRVARIDAGLANGRPFLIMASCGFDAEVTRGMHLTRSGHINRFSYARPILRAMRRYPFPIIKIRVDDQESDVPDCCWSMIFNLPRYAARLAIEPNAIADDGKLDLIQFQRGSVPSGIRYFAGIAMGRHVRYRDVFRTQGVRFELTSTGRVPYQLDGDYVGHLPLKIETLPGRVSLLLPPTDGSATR